MRKNLQNKMQKILLILIALFIFNLTLEGTAAEMAKTNKNKIINAENENILYFDLKTGRVTIKMRPDLAPNHVARIKELVKNGFYDGLKFHRVINGFMAQTGDPKGDGTGGSGKKLKAEFSLEPHKRGTVSMARAADPDSADSQFFIMFADAPHLDRQYTVWGEVIDGMEHIDAIKRGNGYNGTVSDPDKIIKMSLASETESTPEAS